MTAVQRNKGRRWNRYFDAYVVFDLETTGISLIHDEIIEISGIKVSNGLVIETFDTLVKPKKRIPAAATAVNGITNEMVAEAAAMEEVLPLFLKFIDGWTLVGHNINSFDLNFIYDYAVRICGQEVGNDFVDTLYMARHCLTQLKSHTLSAVSEYLGICTGGAHRALNDCEMNRACYEEMAKLLPQISQEVSICPKCGSQLLQRKGKFGIFMGCSSYPGCRHTQPL